MWKSLSGDRNVKNLNWEEESKRLGIKGSPGGHWRSEIWREEGLRVYKFRDGALCLFVFSNLYIYILISYRAEERGIDS